MIIAMICDMIFAVLSAYQKKESKENEVSLISQTLFHPMSVFFVLTAHLKAVCLEVFQELLLCGRHLLRGSDRTHAL